MGAPITRRRALVRTAAAIAAAPLIAAFDWPFAEHAQRPSLLIAGSSLLLPLMEVIVADFAASHPQLDVVVEGGGSGSGFIAARHGAVDIGVMSRDLVATESDLDIHNTLIGFDALAVAVSAESPIKQLSRRELRAIFDGRLTNWSDAGGPDRAIKLCAAAPGLYVSGSFDDLVMAGAEIPRRATICRDAAAMRNAVARDTAAIGYLKVADLDPTVRPLAINGMALDTQNVLLGTYPLMRPCFLVRRGAAVKAAASFVEYCLSGPAQATLAKLGVAAVA